jgi:hypothetical protein
MLPRLLALVLLLLTPTMAWGQAVEADQLQQALDDLEVVEALIRGKLTNATRDQALEQLGEAQERILLVQAAMMKAHAPPPTQGSASVTVAEGAQGTSTSLQVGAPGASLSINLTVNEAEARPPAAEQVVVVPPPPPPPMQPAPLEMPPAAFATLRGAIQTESFSDGKLRVLRGALADHRLSVQQAAQVLPLFDFSSDRVEACVAIHPRLVDPENFYQLYSAFDFESDKEEVRKKLGL